jgi:hypothetical protein
MKGMNRGLVRVLAWPVGLAAGGAALVCWGLALGGYWPIMYALAGQRALPAAGAVLLQGVALAAAGGALLAAALVVALRGEPARGEPGHSSGNAACPGQRRS